MKTSRACTGMLSLETDYFKFLKNSKNIKITCTIVPGLVKLFYLSKPVRMNVKVVIELYYIFSKISKFRYCLTTC